MDRTGKSRKGSKRPKAQSTIRKKKLKESDAPKPPEISNRLLLLPKEVLVMIYQYLSPLDYLSLCQLGQEFDELTYFIKELNFSSCHRANVEEVSSYFSKSRVKFIQKLNFNFMSFVSPRVLVQLICRCKNLKSLSIVECQIDCHQIQEILQKCADLEELSCNAVIFKQDMEFSCPNMKTLYVFYSVRPNELWLISYVVNFPNLKNIFMNFGSDLLLLPFHSLWAKSKCFVVHKRCAVLFYVNHVFVPFEFDIDELKRQYNLLDSDELKRQYSLLDSDIIVMKHTSVCNTPPYLQFHLKEEDISALPPGPYDAISSLRIILSPQEDFCLFTRLLESLENIAANGKLNHLSFLSMGIHTTQDLLKQQSSAVCDMIKSVALSCQNMTMLDIATVHFVNYTPFANICLLKNLKTLTLPTCAFKKPNMIHESSNPVGFSEAVSNCEKVENFILVCCLKSIRHSEVDVRPLQNWKKLKNLVLHSVTFRTYRFLKNVADSCKKFESLTITTSKSHVNAFFTNDVIYLLKNAKNLLFLRINAAHFNPMYERFWDAIGQAVNLEGICITSMVDNYIKTPDVLKALRKLKYLRLFHFVHPRIPRKFITNVRKSMKAHGICNIQISASSYVNFDSLESAIESQSYLHPPPEYDVCCQSFHFKASF